jgi:hypothetical protein
MLAQGKRERLVRVREAPGKVRDCALFELEIEPAPEDWAARMRDINLVNLPEPEALPSPHEAVTL